MVVVSVAVAVDLIAEMIAMTVCPEAKNPGAFVELSRIVELLSGGLANGLYTVAAIMAALSRSAELTKGVRLKILGLFLVLGVGFWLLSIVLGFVGLKMYGPATSAYGFEIGNLLGSAILGTISNVLWGTIQPSLYVELRQAKEGTSAERLAEVFA